MHTSTYEQTKIHHNGSYFGDCYLHPINKKTGETEQSCVLVEFDDLIEFVSFWHKIKLCNKILSKSAEEIFNVKMEEKGRKKIKIPDPFDIGKSAFSWKCVYTRQTKITLLENSAFVEIDGFDSDNEVRQTLRFPLRDIIGFVIEYVIEIKQDIISNLEDEDILNLNLKAIHASNT